MAKRLNSVVGIDIGSRSIKVAEVRNTGKEIVVSAVGMIETPEGAVDHTGVYNSDAVGAAIKKILADTGAASPHAVISVAGQASVLVRTLEVPKMNDKELAEHMQWEINRNIPFSESTVVSDFKPLGDDDPASQNMDVVMAISPQSAIDTLVACAKKAGKQLAAIDVEPLGIARALKVSYDDAYENQTICIVDVGHKTTAINIYRNGKLLMPRTIPIGGELFTKAIADSMGVSMDAAEGLKMEKSEVGAISSAPANPFAATAGFTAYNPFSDEAGDPAAAAPADGDAPSNVPAPVPSGGDAQVNQAMSAVLDEFAAELRRSIDYFKSRGGDVNVVGICGGGSKLNGLDRYIESAVGVRCDRIDPMRRLNVNIKKVAPGYQEQHREEFAVAIGNGLHVVF